MRRRALYEILNPDLEHEKSVIKRVVYFSLRSLCFRRIRRTPMQFLWVDREKEDSFRPRPDRIP